MTSEPKIDLEALILPYVADMKILLGVFYYTVSCCWFAPPLIDLAFGTRQHAPAASIIRAFKDKRRDRMHSHSRFTRLDVGTYTTQPAAAVQQQRRRLAVWFKRRTLRGAACG